jgi:hypothetical protein
MSAVADTLSVEELEALLGGVEVPDTIPENWEPFFLRLFTRQGRWWKKSKGEHVFDARLRGITRLPREGETVVGAATFPGPLPSCSAWTVVDIHGHVQWRRNAARLPHLWEGDWMKVTVTLRLGRSTSS